MSASVTLILIVAARCMHSILQAIHRKALEIQATSAAQLEFASWSPSNGIQCLMQPFWNLTGGVPASCSNHLN